jgi:hypothetical protein
VFLSVQCVWPMSLAPHGSRTHARVADNVVYAVRKSVFVWTGAHTVAQFALALLLATKQPRHSGTLKP